MYRHLYWLKHSVKREKLLFRWHHLQARAQQWSLVAIGTTWHIELSHYCRSAGFWTGLVQKVCYLSHTQGVCWRAVLTNAVLRIGWMISNAWKTVLVVWNNPFQHGFWNIIFKIFNPDPPHEPQNFSYCVWDAQVRYIRFRHIQTDTRTVMACLYYYTYINYIKRKAKGDRTSKNSLWGFNMCLCQKPGQPQGSSERSFVSFESSKGMGP